MPETGLGGLKTGFLRSRQIFEVARNCAQIGLRHHSKALSSNTSLFVPKPCFFLVAKPVFDMLPIFQVSPIKTKTGVRYNSKALSTITVFIFPETIFGGGKAAFCLVPLKGEIRDRKSSRFAVLRTNEKDPGGSWILKFYG